MPQSPRRGTWSRHQVHRPMTRQIFREACRTSWFARFVWPTGWCRPATHEWTAGFLSKASQLDHGGHLGFGARGCLDVPSQSRRNRRSRLSPSPILGQIDHGFSSSGHRRSQALTGNSSMMRFSVPAPRGPAVLPDGSKGHKVGECLLVLSGRDQRLRDSAETPTPTVCDGMVVPAGGIPDDSSLGYDETCHSPLPPLLRTSMGPCWLGMIRVPISPGAGSSLWG